MGRSRCRGFVVWVLGFPVSPIIVAPAPVRPVGGTPTAIALPRWALGAVAVGRLGGGARLLRLGAAAIAMTRPPKQLGARAARGRAAHQKYLAGDAKAIADLSQHGLSQNGYGP